MPCFYPVTPVSENTILNFTSTKLVITFIIHSFSIYDSDKHFFITPLFRFAFFSMFLFYQRFSLLSKDNSGSYSPGLYFNVLFSVSNSIISIPDKLNSFHITWYHCYYLFCCFSILLIIFGIKNLLNLVFFLLFFLSFVASCNAGSNYLKSFTVFQDFRPKIFH